MFVDETWRGVVYIYRQTRSEIDKKMSVVFFCQDSRRELLYIFIATGDRVVW
jgi:hypothetical protein